MRISVDNLQSLPPERFELLIAELMELSGFRNVVVLGGTGDEGLDIRAEWSAPLPTGDMLNTTWAAQCKRYSRPIGPADVQEILNWALEPPSDLLPSRPDFFLLATSSRLTPNARRTVDRANSNRTKYSCRFVVWDGEVIIKRIAEHESALEKFFLPQPVKSDKTALEQKDPPVLRLSILLDPEGDAVLLTFMLESDIIGPTTVRARNRLRRDEFDHLVQECQQLAARALYASFPEESERLLRETGRKIHELIPDTIVASLRSHGDSYIRITSNIHVIPFELAFDQALNGFLGELNRVGRIQVSDYALIQRAVPQPSVLLIGSVDSFPNSNLPSLPESEKELKMLSTLLSSWGLHVSQLSGRGVTREKVNGILRDKDFQIIHFAGHGILNSDDQSGLLFSDGFVSFDDLTRIPLGSAPLIVLSACSSGIALNDASRSYFHAGASGVVGFVGPVTDDAANLIAGIFYEELGRGARLGDALRTAKTAQRATRPADYSWASLVLFGDPTRRPIVATAGTD